MPEGSSPEIIHAPDIPKAKSSTPLVEKPQQPKIEANPNTPPHPSENFPWLPKEDYFRLRDQYVLMMAPDVEKEIKNDPKFKYKDDPEITKTVATEFSRALFVADYFKEQLLEEHSIPITAHAASDINNNSIRATTAYLFQLKEHYIEDWLSVDPSQIDELKLKSISIYVNMNRLGKHIEIIRDLATEALIEKGKSVDFAERWKAEHFNEVGIEQEVLMAHEMSHAFYMIIAASNPKSLKNYREMRKKYRSASCEKEEDLQGEELRLYRESPIEQDAHKWEEAFMQHNYPDYILVSQPTHIRKRS